MELTEPEIPSVEKKRPNVRDLTIMIVRSVGKVHSFKISFRILIGVTIFFLIYIPISISIINRYLDQRPLFRAQSEEIKRLKREVSKGKKTLLRSEQHVALLEDYLQNLDKPQEPEDASKAVASKKVGNSQKRVASRGGGSSSKKNEAGGKKPTTMVDVKDMDIRIEGSMMSVNFKLVNAQPGETAVGGYIHIIAIDKNTDPPGEWAYPKEKLENGVPLNFRRGQLFLIQRFKSIDGEFNLIPDSEPPSAIKVLVYDRSGMLILEKEFEVSNVS